MARDPECVLRDTDSLSMNILFRNFQNTGQIAMVTSKSGSDLHEDGLQRNGTLYFLGDSEIW